MATPLSNPMADDTGMLAPLHPHNITHNEQPQRKTQSIKVPESPLDF
jgi:hypothetical protein